MNITESRLPQDGAIKSNINGKDLDLIKKKIQKAINMARSKGGNRYIIYKEFLHGEIEDSDK